MAIAVAAHHVPRRHRNFSTPLERYLTAGKTPDTNLRAAEIDKNRGRPPARFIGHLADAAIDRTVRLVRTVELFSRKTSTPAWTRRSIVSASLELGPKVATIFVCRSLRSAISVVMGIRQLAL